ncbi:mitochondrial outer membrane protein SLC25A46 [Lampris incognitus]|uniref:mitochondrial outer membrane protein SLC25A46 n=1 Tax=Lampris incognitus TaxID=2546036 RepID=UPI0024B5CAF2|nr:mitochondrial outer membrane protein SLC25A46 [Lampris incognitus]
MTSRRPETFDGLEVFNRGRDEPACSVAGGYTGRPFGGGAPVELQQGWITEPPDIPGSRNLHHLRGHGGYDGDRTPQYEAWTGPEEDTSSSAAATGSGGPSAEQLDRFAGFGIGLVSLFTENVLAHPFIVFRRQCQVNYHAKCHHLSPFTVVVVMYNITKTQGPKALWKGMGSTFIVQGITLGAEGIISECTSLPRELPHKWTVKQALGHLLLKGLTLMVALPFYTASLIETVQSDVVSDTPGPLDCLREGFARLLASSAVRSRRLLPLAFLLGPTLIHGLLRYTLASAVQRGALSLLLLAQKNKKMTQSSNRRLSYFPELAANLAANLVADAALLPLEGVLHQLSVQGTRTIVDDTDRGAGVLPINTQYEGFTDCLAANSTGCTYRYRGLGAVLLQYGLGAIVLGATKAAYNAYALA